MSDLMAREKDSTLRLRREIFDLLDELRLPRSVHREMDRLFEDFASAHPLLLEMDRLLDEFESPPPLKRRLTRTLEHFTEGLRHPFARTKKSLFPSLELEDRDGEYLVTAELPGVREQDVDIRVEGEVLSVNARRRDEETKRVGGTDYIERSFDSFSRSLSLPAGADLTKIEANFRRGALEVRIPKTTEVRGRKIPISRAESASYAPGNGPPAS